MLFSGCVFDNEFLDSDEPSERKHEYVCITIRNSDASSTRAGEFEDGTPNENNIRSVRFYFFNEQGDGFPVANIGTARSYIDFFPESSISNQDNVEKILETTLLLSSPSDEDESKPDYLIAIINPPASLTSAQNSNIVGKSTLISAVDNYLSELNGSDDDYFVMSNSVYLSSDQVKVVEISLKDKIYPDISSAVNHPVDVYVERVAAKVRLSLKLPASDNLPDGVYKLPLNDEGDNSIDITGENTPEEIYIKFLGWNVTAKADKSNLIKNINPQWDASLFGSSTPWNEATRYRSYWAINPEGLNYIYGDFTGERDNQNNPPDPNSAVFIKAFDSANGKRNYTYVHENAAKNEDGEDNDTHTQLIVGAQLVDKDGKPLEFAEFGNKYYTIARLKTLYVNNVDLWKQTSANSFEKIKPDDIDFKTASSLESGYDKNDVTKLTPGIRYYVYAQLKDGTYYRREAGSEDNFTVVVDGNGILRGLGPAKIWKDGYTYYSLNIKHLADDGDSAESTQSKGCYGVVRNHLYDYSVTSVIGLGVPVYDPDEVIIPEDIDDNTTLAVELKITNWRLFRKQLEFKW